MDFLWIIGVFLVVFFLFKVGKPGRPPVSNVTDQDVIDALKQGQKIQAIKYYRTIHGVGLKEAKEAVEAMDIES
ncbi:hypothetical protein FLL46_18875 [Aliikangiella coralliicola]|uniref:Large ribosomal subunit protein bL12 C-terminal domain-containing protein n=1 Tax=Aliikangiella coralliicola TaxID=2592383 RepID=A0A545U991_9GAMM|nr:hypothetical protein FLL46_18875 [Aliikangiella coralliicola]